jgi:hypothetical protein
MDIIEMDGLFNIISFIVSLVIIVILFGIIRRTKDEIKYGFLFIFLGIITFTLFEVVKIFEAYQIINKANILELLSIVFIILLAVGMWKLRTLIRGLSDFGQAFVITSADKYDNKLISIIKDVRDVCYVTIKESYTKTADILDLYGIDTSKIQFIDASGEKCKADNCINIQNNANDIKSTINRVLKEKNIRSVIVDDVTEVKNVESFELPLFIQETSSLIKANEAQGFFMAKIENLSMQTINDINMIVDKVVSD